MELNYLIFECCGQTLQSSSKDTCCPTCKKLYTRVFGKFKPFTWGEIVKDSKQPIKEYSGVGLTNRRIHGLRKNNQRYL